MTLRTRQPLKVQSWHDRDGYQPCPTHRRWEAFLLLFPGVGKEMSNALRTRAQNEYGVSG